MVNVERFGFTTSFSMGAVADSSGVEVSVSATASTGVDSTTGSETG